MKNDINSVDLLGIKKNKNVIEVGSLKVSKNSIYFDDSVLQISNVNHMYITKFRKDPFPFWTIFGILIGMVALCLRNVFISIIGIAAIAFSIYLIYSYIQKNKNDTFGLYIQMSSGYYKIISSEDYSFLKGVQSVIADNFIENYNLPTTINLDNKNIVIERNEGVVNTGDNARNEYINNAGGSNNQW